MGDSENKSNLEVIDLIDMNSPNKSNLKECEDCFTLEFEPDDISKLSVSECGEISVVAEKGQVALRDFPHSRHSCAKYPFTMTNHESYCELCYCFVCDIAAPCEKWSGSSGHCHAMDNEAWMSERKAMKELHKTVKD